MYLDPPYYIARAHYYTHTTLDHKGMAELLMKASSRGVHWVLSYNDTPDIHRMYKGVSMLSLPAQYGYIRKGTNQYQYATVRRSELLFAGQPLSANQRQIARALFFRPNP